jgi:hypothetical protein
MSDGTPGETEALVQFAANANPLLNLEVFRIEMSIACLIDAVKRLARDPNDEIYRQQALELSRRAGETLLGIKS